jgi:hypothetical protein
MTYWITKIDDDNQDMNHIINQDIAASAEEIGFQALDFKNFPNLSNQPARRAKIISALTSVVQGGDLVVIQFPLWTQLNFQEEFINQIRKRPHIKMAALVHDVIPWMRAQTYNPDKDFFLSLLRKFDLIITSGKEMSKKLRDDKIWVPSLPMRLWDFPYQGPFGEKQFKKQLNFYTDCTLKEIDYQAGTPLKIFSQSDEKSKFKDLGSVEFEQITKISELPYLLKEGFAVINAQNIISNNDYDYKSYFSYVNSKRLSLYLSSGIPLIVPSNLPQAKLVKEHHLGFVLDDLNQIDQLLLKLTQKDYLAMVKAIKPWQEAVTTGFFSKRTLLNVIRILELGNYDLVFEEAGER